MKTRYILLLILILATILRLSGIGEEAYWLDETISVRWAQESLKTSLDMVVNDVHPPMYMLILWVWIRLVGISPIATRLLSTVFSLLSILMVYYVGKRLFSDKAGLTASTILAFSTIDIYYAQETRAYSFIVLLTLISFYYFISLSEELTLKNTILYFVSTLILIYTHVFAVLIVLVQNLFYIFLNYKSIKKLLKWSLIQTHLLILYIPWILILLKQMTEEYHTNWIPMPHWYSPLVSFVLYSGSIMLFLVFLIVVIIALIKKGRNNPWKNITLLSMWIVVPMGVVLIFSFLFKPLFHERFFLFVIPAIILLVSWALDVIIKNRWLLIACLTVIISLSIPPIYYQYYITNKDDWIRASRFLENNVKEGDIIFIHPYYQQDPFTYYFNRQCFKDYYISSCNYRTKDVLSLNYLAVCCNSTTLLTSTDENNYLVNYTDRPMWVVDVRSEIYDKDKNLYRYLNKNMEYQNTTKFYGGIDILKYNPKD